MKGRGSVTVSKKNLWKEVLSDHELATFTIPNKAMTMILRRSFTRPSPVMNNNNNSNNDEKEVTCVEMLAPTFIKA